MFVVLVLQETIWDAEVQSNSGQIYASYMSHMVYMAPVPEPEIAQEHCQVRPPPQVNEDQQV